MSAPLYTIVRIRSKTEHQYGPAHAADNEFKTRCGQTIDHNWFILTNHRGTGTVTCKRCKTK